MIIDSDKSIKWFCLNRVTTMNASVNSHIKNGLLPEVSLFHTIRVSLVSLVLKILKVPGNALMSVLGGSKILIH